MRCVDQSMETLSVHWLAPAVPCSVFVSFQIRDASQPRNTCRGSAVQIVTNARW